MIKKAKKKRIKGSIPEVWDLINDGKMLSDNAKINKMIKFYSDSTFRKSKLKKNKNFLKATRHLIILGRRVQFEL